MPEVTTQKCLTTTEYWKQHPNTELTLPPPVLENRDEGVRELNLSPPRIPNGWELVFNRVRHAHVRPALLDDEYWDPFSLEDPVHYLEVRAARDWFALTEGTPVTVREIVEVPTYPKFKNGNARKNPILVPEFREYKVTTKPALLEAINRNLDATVTRFRRAGITPNALAALRGRADYFQGMAADPEAELHLTPKAQDARWYALDHKWVNVRPTPALNFVLKAGNVAADAEAVLPPLTVAPVLPRGGFKLVVRAGFVEEVHCPEWYWSAHWWRMVPVDIGAALFAPKTYVKWENNPPHPIRTVVLTDRPDLPPLTVVPMGEDLIRGDTYDRILRPTLKKVSYDLENSPVADLTEPDDKATMRV